MSSNQEIILQKYGDGTKENPFIYTYSGASATESPTQEADHE